MAKLKTPREKRSTCGTFSNHIKREKVMRYAKALGLSLLAALSLMAFAAAGANAGQLLGDFTVDGNLLSKPESITGKLESAEASSLLVPNLNFAIRCHNLAVESGTLLPLEGGRSFGHGKLTFTECLAYTHKTLEPLTKCTVGNGTIKADVLIHVVRDKAEATEGTAYVLAEPAGGLSANFTTIEFGALCGALAEETIEVKGSIVGLTLPGTIKEKEYELKVVEASETIQLLFKDKLMFGTNQASLDGAILVTASGQAGKPLRVKAGA